MIGEVDDVFLLFPFELICARKKFFDRAKLGDEFFSGLFTDPGDSWNIIGGVTPEAEDVDDLLGVFNFPILKNGG